MSGKKKLHGDVARGLFFTFTIGSQLFSLLSRLSAPLPLNLTEKDLMTSYKQIAVREFGHYPLSVEDRVTLAEEIGIDGSERTYEELSIKLEKYQDRYIVTQETSPFVLPLSASEHQIHNFK